MGTASKQRLAISLPKITADLLVTAVRRLLCAQKEIKAIADCVCGERSDHAGIIQPVVSNLMADDVIHHPVGHHRLPCKTGVHVQVQGGRHGVVACDLRAVVNGCAHIPRPAGIGRKNLVPVDAVQIGNHGGEQSPLLKNQCRGMKSDVAHNLSADRGGG